MPLCGSSKFCGCAVTSVGVDFAELDGYYPSIDVAGGGTPESPWNLTLNDDWSEAVVSRLLVTGKGWEFISSGSVATVATWDVAVPPGVFHKIRFTWTGPLSDTATNMTIQINGDATANLHRRCRYTFDSNGALVVGSYTDGANYIAGNLGDISGELSVTFSQTNVSSRIPMRGDSSYTSISAGASRATTTWGFLTANRLLSSLRIGFPGSTTATGFWTLEGFRI
jgi:hypothetical protein